MGTGLAEIVDILEVILRAMQKPSPQRKIFVGELSKTGFGQGAAQKKRQRAKNHGEAVVKPQAFCTEPPSDPEEAGNLALGPTALPTDQEDERSPR